MERQKLGRKREMCEVKEKLGKKSIARLFIGHQTPLNKIRRLPWDSVNVV